MKKVSVTTPQRMKKKHGPARAEGEQPASKDMQRGRVGKKVVTNMDDIALLAKVSKTTVSRVMKDSPRISEKTKKHVLAIARQHGYAVNRNARKLWQKRTGSIAVVVDFPSLPGRRISEPFHFELLADIAQALAVRQQDLLLCAPAGNDSEDYLHMLSSRIADGLIFLGQGRRERMLRALGTRGAPFVVWGAASEQQSYCTVGSDNLRGGTLAGQRFASLGRTRVLFVGDTSHPELLQRRRGLEHGLRLSEPDAVVTELQIDDLSFESCHHAMQSHLLHQTTPPNAVFAYSDTAAMAVIAALKKNGLSVPGHVSVIGYDDIPMAEYFEPALTTIRQDTRQAGALLVEKLMQLLEGARPQSATLRTELVVRQT